MEYIDIGDFHICKSKEGYEIFDDDWDGLVIKLPLTYTQDDIQIWISGYEKGYKIGKDFGQICGESNIRIAIKKTLGLE